MLGENYSIVIKNKYESQFSIPSEEKLISSPVKDLTLFRLLDLSSENLEKVERFIRDILWIESLLYGIMDAIIT